MTTIMMMLMMLVIKKDIEGVGLSLLSDGVRELSFQSRQTFARMLMMMVTAIVMVAHKQTNIQGVSKKVTNRMLLEPKKFKYSHGYPVHFKIVYICHHHHNHCKCNGLRRGGKMEGKAPEASTSLLSRMDRGNASSLLLL